MHRQMIMAISLIGLVFALAVRTEVVAAEVALNDLEGQYSDKAFLFGMMASYQNTEDLARLVQKGKGNAGTGQRY